MKKLHFLLCLLLTLPLAIFSQSNPPSDVVATAVSHNKVRVDWGVPEGTTNPARLNLFNQADMVTHYGVGANGADVSAMYGGQGNFGNNVRHSSGFMIADDFELNAAAQISKMTFYAYETGASIDTSTFTAIYVAIFDHQPTTTSTPIWGDTSTNVIGNTYWTGIYRVQGTTASYLANVERPIMAVEANINTTLPAGNYWVVISMENSDNSKSIWVNPRCDLNEVSTGNAMQYAYNSEAEVWEWTAWEDGTSLEQMGLPFMVSGSYVSENLLGFNVYKDGIQLNTQMLENFTYTDTAGIEPTTDYCYVVEAVYANNVTASSTPTCVTTPLDPCVIISFPYEENFDTYGTGTGTYPDCWSRYYSGTTTTYPYISSTYSHSSSGSLYLYAGSSYWVMGISPMLSPDIPMNSTYISFMLRKTTASHKMIVGVMDHPDSLSSFVAIDTISPSATSTWEEFTIFLDSYQGNGKYIAFRSGTGSSLNYVYLDDFKWNLIPSCRKPMDLLTSVTGSHTARVEWTPAPNTTTWTFEYRLTELDEWTVVENLTTPYYEFTGLDANTNYTYLVRVKTICADGESEYLEGEIDFTTFCEPISQIPYSEGFDDYGTGTSAHHPCWTIVPGSYSNYPYINTTNNGGVGSLYFYSTTTATTAVSFALDESIQINRLYMTLDGRTSNVAYHLLVGVMTNPDSLSTFVVVDTLTIETTNTWTPQTVDFSSYTGNGRHIAFCTPDTTNNFYIDNLFLAETQTCAMPGDITMAEALTNSITVAWAPAGTNVASYELEIMNMSDSTVNNITGIQDTSYVATGLSVNTEYSFRVRAYCDDQSHSYWTENVSFRTACNPISELPYIEHFDDYGVNNGAFPYCWTRPLTYISGTIIAPYIVNAYSVSAPNSLRLQSNRAWAATQAIDADLHGLQISFYYNKEGANSGVLEVGVMSNPADTSTFELVGVVDPGTSYKTWHFAEFNLDSTLLTGTGNYIAFRQVPTSDTYTNWFYWIDDVMIDYIPSCPRPTNITIENITGTTADVSWSANDAATSWNVRYRQLDTDTWIEMPAYVNNVSLTGLAPNTHYEFEVKLYCGSEESYYSLTETFMTSCGAIASFPYTENFDLYGTGTGTFPTCWDKYYSTSGNYPYINTTNFSAPGSAYMYATTTNYTLAIMPEVDSTISLNTLAVSFMMRKGTATYNIIVGVMSHPDSISSFEPIDTVTTSATNVWEELMVSFANYQGTGRYIAFKSHKGATYLDNVMLDLIPTCFRPTDVTVTAKTENSIDIAWTPGADEIEWNLAYQPVDSSDWTIVEFITDTFYTINNLQPGTAYNIKVRSVCNGDVTEYTYPITEATNCLPVATLPYMESFDTYGTGTGAYPTCWTRYYSGTTTTYPYINTTNFSAPGSMYMYGTTSYYTLAITPEFDETIDLRTLKLSFKMRTTTATYKMVVGTMTNPLDPETFHEVGEVYVDATSTWEDKVVYLMGCNENDRYIAFKCGDLSATNSYYFDDLVIEQAEECITPQYVTIDQITYNSATLSWNASESETNFEVLYGETGFAIDTVFPISVLDNPFTLTGLQPETTYDFYVRTVCSNGEYSAYSQVITFTTACSPQSIPYYNSFDDGATGTSAFPDCWTKVGAGTCYIHATNKFNGVGGLYFYTTSSNYVYAVLPEFNVDINQLQVNFFGKFTNTTYYVDLGVMTDPTDTSTFELVSRIEPRTTVWNSFSIPLNNYQGTGRYIAIRSQSTTSNYLQMDNLVVDYAPICVKPTQVACDNITLTTAELSWNSGNVGSSWEIAYGPEGFNPNVQTTGSNVVTATSTLYTLTNLLPGTMYDVYVRTMCGGDDGNSEWSTVYTFATECEEISQLPYTETFEDYGDGYQAYPVCWDKIRSFTTTNNYPYIIGTQNSTPNGENSLYFYSSANNYSIATTPAISSSLPINTLMATFKLRKASAAYEIVVGVMSNPNDRTTFVAIDTLSPSAINTWEEFEVYFNNYTGTAQYIAFLSERESSTNYMFLDDFRLDILPSCIRPIDLTVSNITQTSATLSWTERNNATSWNIEYGPIGFEQGQGTVVSGVTNPYTLTGLTSSTMYDVYVQSACSTADMSDWSEVMTFATECDLISNLPYTENFDSYAGTTYSTEGPIPLCWATYTDNNTRPAPHVVGSGQYWYPVSQPNALSFVGSSPATNAYAVLPEFSAPLNTLQVAFAFRMESATSGTLKVGYVTDVNNLATSFVEVATLTNTTTITNDSVDFTSVTATAGRITFLWNYTGSSYYSCNIDDVVVTALVTEEPCDAPVNVQVSPTETAATVTWVSTADAWVVEYKEATAENWTASPTLTSATYNITGLTPSTDYVVRVKAICDTDTESDWSVEIPFTTLAGQVTTYVITASASGPGTIAPNGTVTVQEGSDVTFTFAANAGAVVDRLLVDDAETAVPANNEYTFSAVVANHTIAVEFVDETGIEEIDLNTAVVLYPNPATSQIQIQVADSRFLGAEMQIFDVYGKLISNATIEALSTQVDVSQLANGMYMVRINAAEGMVTKRFVKR